MTTAPNWRIGQHDLEIQRNRRAWDRKPVLREIYHDFYRQIAAQINPGIPGPIVELGSGMGRIKEVIPECLTTDLFPNPWLDGQENCYALKYADGSVSALILFDVWHHLRYPGAALREFHRVLAPGGRLILFEPAASWLGGLVYRFFHHESMTIRDSITWEAPADFFPANVDYYAAQGSATRLFWWGEARHRLSGWKLREVRPLISFAYFASGGFSGPQLAGRFFHGLLQRLDRLVVRFPRAFAARLLVVLEKDKP